MQSMISHSLKRKSFLDIKTIFIHKKIIIKKKTLRKYLYF